MKTKSLPLGALVVIIAIVSAGMLFPTSIESQHEKFKPLTDAEFSAIRSDAIAFGHSIAPKGINVIAGDNPSQSIQFNCHNVPILTLINGPTILSMLTYARADSRAPDVASFRKELYVKLPRSGTSRGGDAKLPSGFAAFILKYRDGIDITADRSQQSKNRGERRTADSRMQPKQQI